ncbi:MULTISPECIES: OsmC family protein [Carboxydothermus]|uniref:OsmC family protein n=2 Tax=Carboxydothermus TaxID=129957 RepID=Q3ADS1_CARHZ|nr:MULTISPECIES: OsmC family protein [Carboxydothermus]ABB13934.1 osmC family protein [Carboxydothermus hydrogenoformans Z-2901]NYE56766.1 putative redox protein [Carboxydothermus ferrireducens DSM 11255]
MIKVTWEGKMKFRGIGPSNHEVFMDTDAAGGEDTAARPAEVMMMSLGGCTGMDVVAILNKMQIAGYEFWLEIEPTWAEDHPKILKHVKMTYCFKGENLPKDKIERAVFLSQTKYCRVSNTLIKAAPMEVYINLNGETWQLKTQ